MPYTSRLDNSGLHSSIAVVAVRFIPKSEAKHEKTWTVTLHVSADAASYCALPEWSSPKCADGAHAE